MSVLLALLSGASVAVTCGVGGSFLVVRGEVFSGDALSHVAFAGALAALALGWDLRLGLYGACLLAGVLLALLAGGSGRLAARGGDDTVVGILFAWVLGLGALFLSLFSAQRGGDGAVSGHAGVSVLFGSLLGQSSAQAWTTAGVALGATLLLSLLARPLLFASVDGEVARAMGVPTRLVTLAFFVLLGLAVGMATQAVGALLLLGLLAAPAGAARALTPRPYLAMVLAAVIGVLAVALGLALAELAPVVPPSFGIVCAAALAYAAVGLWRLRRAPRLGSAS